MVGRTPEPDDDREPTPDADDIDIRFAEITASLGDLTVPPAEPEEGRLEDLHPEPAAPVPATPGPRDFELGAEVPLEDDDEPGFAPPEPPALTGSDPLLTTGWIGVVAPVALVFVYLMLWRNMPPALLLTAGVVFVLSVGILIWRLPAHRDPHDHDDGAVV